MFLKIVDLVFKVKPSTSYIQKKKQQKNKNKKNHEHKYVYLS